MGAAVAHLAGEHEVPDSVDRINDTHLLQRVREEVVDVGERLVVGVDADHGVAVEALALLVAVESVACSGDGLPSPQSRIGDQKAGGGFVLHGERRTRHFERPGALDEAPARFDLRWEARELWMGVKVQEVIGDADALGRAGTLVEEESGGDVLAVDDVEGVDDVVEAVLGGGAEQLVSLYLAAVEGSAGFEERAGARGDLFVGFIEVLAYVARERHCEVVEGDGFDAVLAELEEGLRQSELVRGDVPTVQDDGAPHIMALQISIDEACHTPSLAAML